MIPAALQRPLRLIISAAWAYFTLVRILPVILREAYEIRLHAINEYGPVIHEFDPYFNFRATEYLYEHGWKKFVTWFDYMVWYPLGRPVGTTIYPGMQVTAVFIKNHILGDKMSLNDICCYIPAWFGVSATLFTALLTYECSLPVKGSKGAEVPPFGSILEHIPIISSLYNRIARPLFGMFLSLLELIVGSDLGLRQRKLSPSSHVELSSPAVECGLFAAMVMAIVPAHLMRSIGGGYDNESIANTAMTLVFYLWVRTLRGDKENVSNMTWVWGAITGVAYLNMVAAWGGYVFVLNLVGAHTGILVLLGRFSTKLYRAYTAFYVVGTSLAIQVPVVGWTPLKSLEQMGPLAVFVGIQALELVESIRRRKKLTSREAWKLRFTIFGSAAAVAVLFVAFLFPTGYFAPLSSRVRGLFVKHTKTGNPLVDSVAEHQPASSQAYEQYLDKVAFVAPVGFMLVAFRYFHDSSSFLLVYGLATYFFSLKMVRLILLTAPIASALFGVVFGRIFGFFLHNICGFTPSASELIFQLTEDDTKKKTETSPKKSVQKKGKNKSKSNGQSKSKVVEEKKDSTMRKVVVKIVAVIVAFFVFQGFLPDADHFLEKSRAIAKQLSQPTIMMKGRLKSGEEVLVDDYRECYWWLRDNTPEDSRVMAWWDYGYQLTAIANRTTIADGNTWNHEHIALLGRALTSSEKDGHRIARHLADYVLVWAGGGGDDLAKSPHLARIANSVYRSMCPGDPICRQFGMTQQHGPSPMMRESLLFKLHSHGMPGVSADPNRFQEKYTSKYGKCRIFKVLSVSKESKEWVANPKNRVCDVEGSWFCPGQYPPALQKVLAEKKDFSQLENFNSKEEDSEYQEQYFKNLNKPKQYGSSSSPKKQPFSPERTLTPDVIERINAKWEDNEQTSNLWQTISSGNIKELSEWLQRFPELGHLRSSDGRGPMWWAYEHNNKNMIRLLKKVGVTDDRKDAQGLTPKDLQRTEL